MMFWKSSGRLWASSTDFAEMFKQDAKSLSEASGLPVETCEAKLSLALAATKLAKTMQNGFPCWRHRVAHTVSLAKKLECHENKPSIPTSCCGCAPGRHTSSDVEVFQRPGVVCSLRRKFPPRLARPCVFRRVLSNLPTTGSSVALSNAAQLNYGLSKYVDAGFNYVGRANESPLSDRVRPLSSSFIPDSSRPPGLG
jgi:hypothetical protein